LGVHPVDSDAQSREYMIPLLKQYPLLKEKIPYISLGEFPTPIKHLDKLGEQIGTDNLYLKHDGLSGSFYGGNKIRKLEFLLGDALRQKAKRALTFGFAGSNHALATAIYAQRLGLKCTSILLTQPNAQYVRNNLLLHSVCGAEINHHKNEMTAVIPTIIATLRNKLKDKKFPYIIAPGGSSPLGTIGYVNAGFELKDQIANGVIPEPDKIYLPLGTMGTAVGLTIGLKAAGLKTRVVPVRVSDTKYGNEKKFIKLYNKTLALIHSKDSTFPQVKITSEDINIRHDFFGGHYARFTEQGVAALNLVEQSEGIVLDGTYTGKAMAALIGDLRTQDRKEEIILFWNTHNERNIRDIIKGVDYHQLPRHFHQYFEESIQPLDRTN